MTLISQAQKEDGHALFFYLSPEFDRRYDVAYQHAVETDFGGYLQRAGILRRLDRHAFDPERGDL